MGRIAATFWMRVVLAVARHPRLWATALVQLHRLAPSRWWRRPPFVPVPDRRYLEFRWATAYGAGRTPTPVDVVAYLEWCRERDR
ncbi:MAG TPA: hypothetical protein VFZ83_03380 [Acidimicrobiia bacterium]|nr:hypothetical protein [Acidimicrobiia bacterium]